MYILNGLNGLRFIEGYDVTNAAAKIKTGRVNNAVYETNRLCNPLLPYSDRRAAAFGERNNKT